MSFKKKLLKIQRHWVELL